MANEDNLRSRWTLEAEDPKAWRALNLAVERAKLSPGYRPGRSAAELELQARANDLRQRQSKYIEENSAKTREEFMRGGVGGLRSAERDFANDTPYISAGDFNVGGNGPGTSRRRRGYGNPPSQTGPSPTGSRNRRAFEVELAAREDAEQNQRMAYAEGGASWRRGRQESKEQAARNQFVRPNDYPVNSGGTMTRSGQTLTVPEGPGASRMFDDEALRGPKVRGSVGAQFKPAAQPDEQPVGDGDLPNDNVMGQPDPDVREPEPVAQPQTAPQAPVQQPRVFEPAVAPQRESFNATPMAAMKEVGRMGGEAPDYVRNKLYTPEPYANEGFAGNAPRLIDQRKRQGSALASTTRPIAQRIN